MRKKSQVLKQETKTVDNVELIELEPKFSVANPNDYVALRVYVLLDRQWYNLINNLVMEEFRPSDRLYGMFFSSMQSFIDSAIFEKQERTFVDYKGLGKLYQKQLQDKFQPTHHRIEGVNEHLWDAYDGLFKK